MSTLSVATVQHACGSDRESNLAASIAGIKDAAARGAKLIVLQELHTSTYFCITEDPNNFDLAETIPGPTTQALSAIAKALNVVVVCSLFEKRAPGICHNTAVVIDVDGEIAGSYRKMHIPDDPGYFEKFYFTPGDKGFEPIATSIGKLGVLICWDQWFPEAARCMALKGAELLIYPTAIGVDQADNQDVQNQQLDAWVTIQRSHAIANGIPVIACNRIGIESHPTDRELDIAFWGSSFIAGQQGEMIAIASKDKAEVLIAEVSRTRTDEIRRMWPYFRDRRIDAYQNLLTVYAD